MKFFVLASMLLAASPTGAPSAVPSHPVATSSPGVISPDELFSRRALRRARLLIQMRLMQLRDERLECVREALLRQLPAALRPEVPSPSRGSADVSASRCADLLRL